MKKFTFFLLGLSLSLALVAQQVPRDYVVYEIFTGVNYTEIVRF